MASLPTNLVIDIKCAIPITYEIVANKQIIVKVKSKAIKKIAKICANAKYKMDIELSTTTVAESLVSVENKETIDVKV